MKKNYIVYLLSIIVCVGGGYFFLDKRSEENAIKEASRRYAVQELSKINEAEDITIIRNKQETIQDQLLKRKSVLEETIEGVIAGEDGTSFSGGFTSSKKQLSLLVELYEETKDVSLLPVLFQISLDIRNFEDALVYLDQMMTQGGLPSDIDVHHYLYALFNSDDIDFGSLARFKKVIDQYEQNGLITSQDKTFYYSLVTLSRGDLVQYENFITKLKGSEYDDWYELYVSALGRYESFVDTPSYYLTGLLSIGLFQKGRYRQVQHISRSMLSEDPSYLLGYQLNAYASLMLGDWTEALSSLEFLRSHDEGNKELYLYLSGISLYNLQRHQEAILSFSQLKIQKFNQDVLRYRFLSYQHINDISGMSDSLTSLISTGGLTVYDYYTIFDTLFFKNIGSLEFDDLQEELLSLVESCYDQIEEEYVYVCLYGKAGLNLFLNEQEKAYQYLLHASKRFEDRGMYELLGDLAQTLDKTQEATKWYIKALTSTSIIDQQDGLKTKIRQLME